MSDDYTDFGQAAYFAERALASAREAGRNLAKAHRARKKLQIIYWARGAEWWEHNAKRYEQDAHYYWHKATRA